jgi:hypothetical protein
MVCGIECMPTCHIHFEEPKTLYLGYNCSLLDQNLGSTTSVLYSGFCAIAPNLGVMCNFSILKH